MIGKNNQYLKDRKDGTRVESYSIKKFKIGAASVVVGASIFLGMGSIAQASEEISDNTIKDNTLKAPETGNIEVRGTELKETPKESVKPTTKENVSQAVSKKLEASVLDKTKLSVLIGEIDNKIAFGSYSNKTEESVNVLMNELNSAKITLAGATTQAELDSAYSKLVTTVNSKLVTKKVDKKEVPKVDTTEGKPTVGKVTTNTESKPTEVGSRDKRNGKEIDKNNVFRADLAETRTEAPLTATEQDNHFKGYAGKNTDRLRGQIKWFDINSKTATVENLDAGGKLKVGTHFREELSPGYFVDLTVTALRPFNATDTYKARGGAGYDPNAKNVYKDGTDAELKVVNQGSYSIVKTNGLDTRGTTVIQSVKDGANVGVEFAVKAILNGKEIPVNVVFATGEEAGSSEIEIYKTDGNGFELVSELSNPTAKPGIPATTRSFTAETYDTRYDLPQTAEGQSRQLGHSYTMEGSGKPAFAPFITDKAKGFRSTEITEDTVSTVTDKDGKVYTDGLGTQVFGPVATHRASGMSAPVVMTRNAKNVGIYILSSGQQGAMLGFMMLDEGDAPASYGKVAHSISKGNGVKQPYLGSNAPDVDVRTEKITKDNAFKYDDENGEGGDEGARQLMGDKVAKGDNYKIKRVNAGTYEMTVDAHLDGGGSAWVNGWIDFNGNGKFDEGEAAEPVEVTADGEVTLRWTNTVQNLDVTAEKLATRLRIANDKVDILKPTGIAYSGEVEDFEIQQTIPPRGTKETTIDVQGATQLANIKFNAYGHKAYDLETPSTINESVKPQIVKADGSIVSEDELVNGYYVVPGQGKYKVTAKGKDVDVEFVPEDQFVGDADGISIRRTDINGDTTGWGKIGKDIINGEGENRDELTLISEQVQINGLAEKGSMDGRYIPRVMKREIVGKAEVSNDIQGAKQTKTPEFKDTAGNKITPSSEFPVKLVDPETGQPTDKTTIPTTKDGKVVGSYTITPETGEVVFTPNKDFTGEPSPVTLSFSGKVGVDKEGNPVTSSTTTTYQPTVKPVVPTETPAESTKPQGEEQEGVVTFAGGKAKVTYLDKNDQTVDVEKSVPMKADGYTLLAEDGVTPVSEVPARKSDGTVVGKYTLKVVDGKVTAVFTPTDKTYVGDVQAVKIQGEDENGTKVITTYTPHITPVAPTAEKAVSVAKQGDTQKGIPTFTAGSEKSTMVADTLTLLDASGNKVDTLPAMDEKGREVGTYTIDKTTGEVIFTPTDKTYTGKVKPARVAMSDSNGTQVETTYTPSILPVEPKGSPAESTKPQGVVQEGTVTFKAGVVEVNGKEETAPLKENSARLVGPNGKTLEADAKLDVFAEDGKKIGEYTIDPTTNKVTYTPTDKTYTGSVPPAIIRAEDVNGSTAETTYTPTIIPVTPAGTPAKTVGPQGVEQKGTVEFTSGTVEGETPAAIDKSTMRLLDSEGNKIEKVTITKGVKEVGFYELVKDESGKPTGEVKFTPTDKTYVGVVESVTVQVKDENGTPATTTYTPEFTEVVPMAKESVTQDIQGAVQTSPVIFDVKDDEDKSTINFDRGDEKVELNKSTLILVNANGEKVNKVVIPNEGKYVLKDGAIEFTPEKQFVGKATSVTVQIEDMNGKVVKTTYTPEVVGVTPTSENVESSDIQGKVQSGKPKFIPGNERVPMDDEVPATFDNGEIVKTVKGVGKYEVAKDGTVTFTPEKSFTGVAPSVTIKRVDKNGTEVTATYTPTVIPVKPTGENSETEGPRGEVQKSPVVFDSKDSDNTTVNFDRGHDEVKLDKSTLTLIGKDGRETKEVKVPGEGTYVLKDGVIEFTPEKDFVGKASGVTVQVKDVNGTVVFKTYTPSVRSVTEFKDKEGNTIPGSKVEDGKVDEKDFPEYRFVETKVDEKGNTTHIYEKVTTFFKDKDENEIKDKESGTVNKANIPEYRFVETKKLENGDVEHIYEKVTTYFKDKDGNELRPKESGSVEKKDISEYRFVETKVDEKGNVTHIYEKVTTYFKDKDGNEIKPKESGSVEKRDIPEYRFVESKVDKDGNTTHIYEKVTTYFKDKDGNELRPKESGSVDKKEIPEYRFVETKVDKDGNVTHVYEKVTTYFKDKEGNEIRPKESDSVDKKGIPEYRFVETKVDKDGNVTHIYEKVTTFFKDKDGNEIKPKESGSVDKKDIPEYRFVETKVDKDGNTTHVYEKVTTFFKDKDGNELRPKESGSVGKKEIPEYRFVETKVDKDGNVTHVYEKVTPKEEPKKEEAKKEVPKQELKQEPKKEEPKVSPKEEPKKETPKQEPKKEQAKVQTKEQPSKVVEHKQLPNTGSTNTVYTGLGALILGMFAGIRKRKNEE